MKKVSINNLPLWQFESLGAYAGIKHFVTDRSPASDGKEFTLSYSSSPDREQIKNNRSILATAMGVPASALLFPSQVHKTRIVRVTRNTPKDDLLETDSLITCERKVCIAVMSADCVPILLFDKGNNAVAAVHSGWRGTVAKILGRTLQEMHAEFGTEGKDIVACIGPSVCQESYEVGREVIHEVQNAFGAASDLMIPCPDNKAKLDLWKANMLQLQEFGVSSAQIEIADLCTVKNNQHFFSARKGDSGRFAAGIMLV